MSVIIGPPLVIADIAKLPLVNVEKVKAEVGLKDYGFCTLSNKKEKPALGFIIRILLLLNESEIFIYYLLRKVQ